MGRKISKEGFWGIGYETDLVISLYPDRERRHHGMQVFHGAPESHGEESSCEFRDFCNRLYYIDGTCRCMTAWNRSAGLALPISC